MKHIKANDIIKILKEYDVYETAGGRHTNKNVGVLIPKGSVRHIGIELEVVSTIEPFLIDSLIDIHGLNGVLTHGTDGSIEHDRNTEFQIEFRLLTIETKYKEHIKLLYDMLNDNIEHFKVNNSCGLHVHLDSRLKGRSKKMMATRLIKSLPILNKLVAPHRLTNQFCQPNNVFNIRNVIPDRCSKYNAVNMSRKYRTVEVRLHEATLDVDKVLNWVTLLVDVVNSPSLKKFNNTPDNIVKELKPKLTTMNYLKRQGVE